jgi:hypothetical protein
MRQIKIFKGVENQLPALEAEVNAWIAQSQADVVDIQANIAPQTASSKAHATGLTQGEFPPSDVIVVVLYEPRR